MDLDRRRVALFSVKLWLNLKELNYQKERLVAPIRFEILDPPLQYTRYEDTIPANQNDRKLKVYDRKLEGSHSIFYSYFAKYVSKTMWKMFIYNFKEIAIICFDQ